MNMQSSDIVHMVQLGILAIVMCVLLIFTKIPQETILAAFVPVMSALIGVKIGGNAVTSQPASPGGNASVR